MTITGTVHQAVLKVPVTAWTPAAEPGGEVRDGAWAAETGGDRLKGWPKGMRLTVRRERPHPGARLRFTDADGMRLTCFATNTPGEAIAGLDRATASAPAARTASGTPAPPACAIFPCTASRRTRSGWRPSSSPWTCRPGRRCWP